MSLFTYLQSVWPCTHLWALPHPHMKPVIHSLMHHVFAGCLLHALNVPRPWGHRVTSLCAREFTISQGTDKQTEARRDGNCWEVNRKFWKDLREGRPRWSLAFASQLGQKGSCCRSPVSESRLVWASDAVHLSQRGLSSLQPHLPAPKSDNL